MHIEKDFKNKLTAKDYIKYLLNRNMILLLSPILIIALLTATIYSIITDGFKFTTIIYFLPVILFIASYIQMYRVIKHTLKAQKAVYELKITLTDNEYKDLTNGENNSITYDKLFCYKETKEYLYLFVDQFNGLILPKREFNEDEISQMKNTFSKKTKKQPIYTISSWLLVGICILLVILITSNIIS